MAPDTSRSRWRHHGALAAASFLMIGFVALTGSGDTLLDDISLATAYICLILMAVVLCLGPLRALRSAPLVLNIYLRRDIGIWSGLAGLVHLFVATELSMNERYMGAYVNLSTSGLSDAVRMDLFSWGSITGFLVGIFVLLLLILSNNTIMRFVGSTWWKRLQRFAYLTFVLTVLHGFAFQVIEARNVFLVGIVFAVFIGVLILQIFGFRAVKKRVGQKFAEVAKGSAD
jgi:sulfoxide reductase heme-binding subunit YedZ